MKTLLYTLPLLLLLATPALSASCNEECLLEKIEKLERRLKTVEGQLPADLVKRVDKLENSTKKMVVRDQPYRIKSPRISPNGSCLTIDDGNGITIAGHPSVCNIDTQQWVIIPYP